MTRRFMAGVGVALALASGACSSKVDVVGGDGTDADVVDSGSTADTGAPIDTAPPPSSTPTLGDACSKPGALSCNGLGQKLQLLCDGTKWVANGTCSGQQICDTRPGSTLGSCQDPLCAEGDKICTGAKLQKCGPDRFSYVDEATCDTAALCHGKEGLCEKPACAVGEYACFGDALVKCNADRTLLLLDKDCPPGLCDATAGDCRVCTAGAKDCVGTSPRLCDATGHWTTLSPCAGSTPVCTAGVCESGSCTAGDLRCNGDALEKCNASSTGWDNVKTCGAGLCDLTAKDCVECKAGSSDCLVKRPRSCVSGHWVSAAADCSGATPYCEAGACVASPTTTFKYPTISALTSSGTLGLGGGGKFNAKGSWLEDGKSGRSAAMSQMDLDITMSDAMDPKWCAGAVLSWDVYLSDKVIGSYSFSATGADHRIVKTFTFAPILPRGSLIDIKIVSTTDVCTGGGSWNWYPGGTVTVK